MAKTPKKDDTEAEVHDASDTTEAVEETKTDDVIDAKATEVSEPDTVSSDADGDTVTDTDDSDLTGEDTGGDDVASSEQADEIVPQAPLPQPIETRVVERKGGFVPMVLGGAVAAGIGFFGAQYYNENMNTAGADLENQIAAQGDQISDLTSRVDGMPQVDTAPLEDGLSDVQAQIEALTGQIYSISDKVAELAGRPVSNGDGTVDLSGVNTQIEELRAALDTQEGTIAQMVEAAQAEKQDAEEIARQTMARAAVTRILVSLDSGAPFEDALADVDANTDSDIPEALAQTASSGVPTVSALSDMFPDAARAALAASRSETPAGGVGSFLTRQLGVRSVEPREGNDPDAVLSRMEAAVREGRLADALSEMDSLPDAAKAPLAEWAERANLRLTAVQEAEALATSLNSQ